MARRMVGEPRRVSAPRSNRLRRHRSAPTKQTCSQPQITHLCVASLTQTAGLSSTRDRGSQRTIPNAIPKYCRSGAQSPPRAQATRQMAETVLHNTGRCERGRIWRPFEFKDNGSLISLSRFSTVGSLMGNLVGGAVAVEGRMARFI